jgi:hypothetical protein
MNEIYLIQKLTDSTFKIGVSKNPKRRIKSVQTGNEGKLKIFCTYPSEYAYKIEKTLHRLYSHCKCEGEWYNISLVEAYDFNNMCKKIEESIIFLKNNDNIFI